ncbi:MAG: CRTAC1 family protein [Planctomycetota bacterium]
MVVENRRRWAASAWIALVSLVPAAVPEEVTAAEAAGHRRMREELARVRDAVRQSHPYLGLNHVEDARQELAAQPGAGADRERSQLHYFLGGEMLRLGDTEGAIEHLTASLRHANAIRATVPVATMAAIEFQLAVAYLQLGEVQNCRDHHTPDSCLLPIRGGSVHRVPDGSRNAIVHFQAALELAEAGTPLRLKARWLLNIAYMTLGEWPDGVPAEQRIEPEVFASEEEFPRFPNIAAALGVDCLDLSGGVVADDFDGDGLLDILTSTSDSAGPMHFFRNAGDGSFVERTAEADLTGLPGGLNMVQADYDNDGDIDVYVLRGAWGGRRGFHPNSLLRNDGRARFLDVTFLAGLGEVHYPTQTAAWGDYDNDGDLDLYVGNEYDERAPVPNQLFRNEGNGRFVDVAGPAGVRDERFTKAVVWGDYDDDGFPDLYVSNMGHPNRLYRNRGDGTFVDVAAAAGVEEPWSGFPAWFWDFDNDGALDIFAAGYGSRTTMPEVADVAASFLGLPHQGDLDRLYRGDGEGRFVDVAAECGLRLYTLPMGANFGDLDNDGFLDYYLGTGYPYFEALMPNVMYWNRGGKHFADVTVAGGFGHLQKGHAIAFADFDNDGDQDIYEQMGGAYPGAAFFNSLYQNPGFGNHWITIRLIGRRTNRCAIGARIRVDIVEAGAPRSIYRHVSSGGSFGCSPLRQQIGLGAAERIERVEVFWPASRERQVLEGIGLDRFVEITEGEAGWRELDLPRLVLRG